MNIQTKAVHLSLTPAISEYIEKRIAPLEKFITTPDGNANSISVSIEVGKTSNHHQVSAELFSAKGRIDVGETHIWAEATDGDLYAAIDKLRDDLTRELTSQKRKKTHLLRRGGQRIKAMLRGIGGRWQGK